ncbi:MAG TPA: ACP S-malonyltransferase [Burkholderiales bacterium]
MKFAFVFPGQGSQSVGMLRELAAEHPEVERTFAEASSALGYDLWRTVCEGPEERLAQTEVTQPAMLAAGVAVWRVWCATGGPEPAVMAGHSLGEYSALVCAGALEFPEAVRLVADRARFMQEAVPAGHGAMAAILGLSDDAVAAVCAQAAQGEVLEPVNFNSPAQVVIAGSRAAVDRGIEQAKAAGAKRAVLLPMSVPAHSSLMAPAAARLGERLQGVALHMPRIPVLQNATLATAADVEAMREALVRQVASPVRWVQTVERLVEAGARALVECGPGKVLTGLNKRIARDVECLAIQDPGTLAEARARLGAGAA